MGGNFSCQTTKVTSLMIKKVEKKSYKLFYKCENSIISQTHVVVGYFADEAKKPFDRHFNKNQNALLLGQDCLLFYLLLFYVHLKIKIRSYIIVITAFILIWYSNFWINIVSYHYHSKSNIVDKATIPLLQIKQKLKLETNLFVPFKSRWGVLCKTEDVVAAEK